MFLLHYQLPDIHEVQQALQVGFITPATHLSTRPFIGPPCRSTWNYLPNLNPDLNLVNKNGCPNNPQSQLVILLVIYLDLLKMLGKLSKNILPNGGLIGNLAWYKVKNPSLVGKHGQNQTTKLCPRYVPASQNKKTNPHTWVYN